MATKELNQKLEANDENEELVEFKADGEASEIPDPISTGSTRRKADKDQGEKAMPKLGKTGVMQQIVQMFQNMDADALQKVYKGMQAETGTNMSSIKAKGDAKAPVKLHNMAAVKVKEDIEELFKDMEGLNEGFIDNATTLFESALSVKAAIVEEALKEEYEAKLAEAKEEFESQLAEKVEEYLDYVAETWLQENEVAIESALKVEMAENFMQGMANLFAENYIEVPADKIDLVGDLELKIEDLQNKLDEAMEKQIQLASENKAYVFQDAIVEASRGLTMTQQDKFVELVEGLDVDDIDEFKSKLAVIKEHYFKAKPVTESTEINDDPVEIEEEVGPSLTGPMAAYAQAISRTLRS